MHWYTLHDWKKHFAGLTKANELAKNKELESENTLLKKMFVNLSLERKAYWNKNEKQEEWNKKIRYSNVLNLYL